MGRDQVAIDIFRRNLNEYCGLVCERAKLNERAGERSSGALRGDIDATFASAFSEQDIYRKEIDRLTQSADSQLQATRGATWLVKTGVDSLSSLVVPDQGTGKFFGEITQSVIEKGVSKLEDYSVGVTVDWYKLAMARVGPDDPAFAGKTDVEKIAVLSAKLKGSVIEDIAGLDPALQQFKKEELERHQFAFDEAQIKAILGTKKDVAGVDAKLEALIEQEDKRWKQTRAFQRRAEAHFEATSYALTELQGSMNRLEQRQGGIESFLYSQMSIPERYDALKNRGWLQDMPDRERTLANLERAKDYANYASYFDSGTGALRGLQVLAGGNNEQLARAIELGDKTSASLNVLANYLANPSPLSALQSIGSLGGLFGRNRTPDPMARVMKQLRDLDRKLDVLHEKLNQVHLQLQQQALRSESNHLELVGLLQELKDQVTTIESKLSAVVALQGMQHCEGYIRALQRSQQGLKPQLWTPVQLIDFARIAGDDTARCIAYLRQTVPLQDESPFSGNVFVGAFRDEPTEAYILQAMAHAYAEQAFRDMGARGSDPSAADTRRRYLYLLAVDPSPNMRSLRRNHAALAGDPSLLSRSVDQTCKSMSDDDVKRGAFRREIARFACTGGDRLLPSVRMEDALKERFNTRLVVRYAELSREMAFWSDALQFREDGTFESRVRLAGLSDSTRSAKAVRSRLLRDALDRVELTAAQDRFFSSGAGVAWIYDRFKALDARPVTDDGAREELRLLELFLQSRPVLASNLVHYIVEREFDAGPPNETPRRRLQQSYSVLYRNTVDDYISLGFDIRTPDDGDVLRKPHRMCVADTGQCQVIQGPFAWLSTTWRLRYNAHQGTQAQTLPLETRVSADAQSCNEANLPSDRLSKRLGVNVSSLLQRQCAERSFNRECELKPTDGSTKLSPNHVRVCVPSGWSIQFGASALPLPSPRRLATGEPVHLDRAGYLGLARENLIESIVEEKVSDEIEREVEIARGQWRSNDSALRAFQLLQSRWVGLLANSRR